MLEVRNLSASIHGTPILDRLNLTVEDGQVAAIMGPNGSGKSTLSYVIAGKPDYEVTSGEVLLDGENLLDLDPDERARKGVFLAFQYPIEIPGVATMTFLKAALNAQRRARGEADLTTPEFMRRVREGAQKLKFDQEMLRRALNVGFSGGEKKRLEILQMTLLEPRLGVLDETDSGLDIDALKVVADGVNALARREAVVCRHHALSAASRSHQAGCGACDGEGPGGAERRSGACARTGAERLQGLRGRSGLRPCDECADPAENASRSGADPAV